jgi:hypothetical protein
MTQLQRHAAELTLDRLRSLVTDKQMVVYKLPLINRKVFDFIGTGCPSHFDAVLVPMIRPLEHHEWIVSSFVHSL